MTEATINRHFIQQIIDTDIERGKWGAPGDRSVVTTRFPPEPNGYLHIGHAKSVCLNAGLAKEYGGRFFLRFDDTNPAKEEQEFVDSICADVKWLGGVWDGEVRFASDYFDRMYTWAVELIRKGLAYVDEQAPDLIKQQRGNLTEPGAASPFRDRPAEESLAQFEKMKSGGFSDGGAVLRAKIDMASPNMNLRDPVMYRVVNKPHHRTGGRWHIYPMYDWAHGLEDSVEGITHSLCTLEFENHRPLYDWFIEAINKGRGPGSEWGERIHHAQQIEFSRFNLEYTTMSKRALKLLVEGGHVAGWDDPRMITVAGLRRRGYTAESVRHAVIEAGITKYNALTDFTKLENAVRDDLNRRAPRRMAVLDPVKLVITNWGEHGDPDRLEELPAINNPEDERAGTRPVKFGGELWIERDDFMIDPPKKFFRLGPGREVRLRCGYWVRCHDYTADADGRVTEIRCTYDPQTRGGDSPPPDSDGVVRKVKGTLHWVSAADCLDATVRLFDRLFNDPRPGKRTGDILDDLNPDSLTVLTGCKVERSLGGATPDEPAWADGIRRVQFERLGYFCLDRDSTPEALVFNRTVTLKDSWAKEQAKG
ncbi:MAG: glutamine--tRNA ligase/YqeY domain fusion protein [Phycisphaerales bacterium]|nr:glutamine--tRNA ligase/YqeY domain fusion protein [Planctomycetota bacterium]MCH8508807.1 glutamine--tRNA ligase/YqeY domain fusion protein [Phycisphaerales bacterium]